MPRNDLAFVLRAARARTAAADLTDAELLARFRAERDEAAFALLVQRHGPMVLGVCHRVLGSRAAAEDAFQAAFVLLARRAGAIRKAGSLGSWLHGVAARVALGARRGEARRRARERRALDMAETRDGPTWSELFAALDEELGRLPEKYRAPVVLCYLEGKTNEQAAQELGCPKSSLTWRLGRARELLRERLTRRGVTLPAAGLGAALLECATAQSLPAALVLSAVRAAAGAAGEVPPRVAALAAGATGLARPTKTALVFALLAVAGISGLTVAAWGGPGAGAPDPKRPTVPPAADERRPVDPSPVTANGWHHLELANWVATDVDPARGTVSATTKRYEGGLTLSAVPVARDALVLVDGVPGKLADVRRGMALWLRLAGDGTAVTQLVAVVPKPARQNDTLEGVDLDRRTIRVRLVETNSVVTLPVAEGAEISMDGRPSRLDDLRPGCRVALQITSTGRGLGVTAVRASEITRIYVEAKM
jgi:RNA polymerase sigma factor (sigma-70 family)